MTWTRLLVLALAASAAAMAILPILRRRRRESALARYRSTWGSWIDRPRDMAALKSQFDARLAAGSLTALNDRTWEDLNMNDVFSVLDRTVSAIGQQALYSRLRVSPRGVEPAAFEALVERMSADTAARETAQVALSALGNASSNDIWSLTEPDALIVEPWHVMFPVMAVAMVASIAAVPFFPPAIFLIAAGSATSLVMRGTIARHLRVAQMAFRQVTPLLTAAGQLSALTGDDNRPLTRSLVDDLPGLANLKRVAGWVSRDEGAAVSGNLGATVLEYLNLLLFLDANALYFGARQLRSRSKALRRVLTSVGEVDAAQSIGSFRTGTTGWVRPVLRDDSRDVQLRGLRHPLLPDAVPNSLALSSVRGVIITGSNMSGKTTFLRTVGVGAVMAQTVNTVIADAYEAPIMLVASCIGQSDDPSSGKSYYMAEVDSVLAQVQSSASRMPHLYLFDELFRGTNAIERIAAGEAVLRSLVGPGAGGEPSPHLAIAATHDRELVDLLADTYAPFHFTDTVDDKGLAFDYQLKPGTSVTRNAIALLRLRGAPPSLVDAALARAEQLDHARRL